MRHGRRALHCRPAALQEGGDQAGVGAALAAGGEGGAARGLRGCPDRLSVGSHGTGGGELELSF